MYLIFLLSLQTKCHQYWPDPPDVMEYGSFRVKCHSEDCTIAYVIREMVVTNVEVSACCLKLLPSKLNEYLCRQVDIDWEYVYTHLCEIYTFHKRYVYT